MAVGVGWCSCGCTRCAGAVGAAPFALSLVRSTPKLIKHWAWSGCTLPRLFLFSRWLPQNSIAQVDTPSDSGPWRYQLHASKRIRQLEFCNCNRPGVPKQCRHCGTNMVPCAVLPIESHQNCRYLEHKHRSRYWSLHICSHSFPKSSPIAPSCSSPGRSSTSFWKFWFHEAT